jgi:hypothetical protein
MRELQRAPGPGGTVFVTTSCSFSETPAKPLKFIAT